MNRRYIACVLLVFWVFQCSALSLLCAASRWHCQKLQAARMLSGIENAAISTFVFNSESELTWEEPGAELLVEGKLFDVLSIHKQDSKIVLNCISDESEDAVLLAAKRLLDCKEPGAKKNEKESLKYTMSVSSDLTIALLCPKSEHSMLTAKIVQHLPGVSVPPPERAIA